MLSLALGCGGSTEQDSDALVSEGNEGTDGLNTNIDDQVSGESNSEKKEAAPKQPNLGAKCEVDEDASKGTSP